LALIGSLLTVALYPLAFVVLVCRKIYALGKIALLSQMTNDRQELLLADTHIARTGTVVGGVGTVAGGVLLALGSTDVMLMLAALAFVSAAFVSRKLPRPDPPIRVASSSPFRELIPPRIWSATIAVTAIRAAAGALTYLLAFAIKRGGGDEWIYAAGLLVGGIGGLLATLLASRLHRWLEPDGVLVLALLVPGLVCAIGVVTIGNFGILAIAFAIGLGGGIATRSINVLNASVPSLARGRTIARSELVFQVATLVGAGLAVQLAPAPKPGFTVASAVLLVAGLTYGFQRRRSLREQASRVLLGADAPAVERALPHALLVEAGRLASLGAYRMAVVVAGSAVDVLVERRPELDHDPRFEQWRRLADRIQEIRCSDEQPHSQIVIEVLAAAGALLDEAPADGFDQRTSQALL
jgi:predicted MFS family arabinose efflux permease